MRTILFAALLFAFWTAFYAMLAVIKTELFVLGAFVAALLISMVTAAVFFGTER